MMGEMMRTHVLLPKELVARIDERVGPRRRSEFVVEALRRELDQLSLLELMEAAADEARNAPPDDDPPAWDAYPSSVAWVRAQRQVGTDHWANASETAEDPGGWPAISSTPIS